MTIKELMFHTCGGVKYCIEDYDTMRVIEEGIVDDYIAHYERKYDYEVSGIDVDSDNTLVVIVDDK